MPSEDVLVVDVNEKRSSLIRRIEYDEEKKHLKVYFRKYFIESVTHEGVFRNHFDEFTQQQSIGKYYLHYIKPNFKTLQTNFMPDEKKRPPTKNQASTEIRWIDISINVREIKKEWIQAGEKGDYLGMKLRMLPDGQTDKYGNLGMIVQAVPSSVYKEAEAKEKGSGKKIQGPILGNAAELDWQGSKEGIPGTETGVFVQNTDDLPF